MARVLTGIQSTGNPGRPHLGNILGAIAPAVAMSQQSSNESFLFIANLHSLTSLKEAAVRKQNVQAVAAAWLAFGLDTDRHVFYRQSDIPEVCELTWMLSCFAPYPMLANAHSFKEYEQKDELAKVSGGLFYYPVLMAADILLYDAQLVPVGKDQRQHLEMTRDIARAINHHYNEDVLVIPEARIDEKVMTVPGIDGRKMSKSYDNYIDIFLPEKQLKKSVMSIETDSTPLEEPKNPDTCNVFALYSLLADANRTNAMKQNYLKGGYGYGHAKKELLGLILDKYNEERKVFNHYTEEPARSRKQVG